MDIDTGVNFNWMLCKLVWNGSLIDWSSSFFQASPVGRLIGVIAFLGLTHCQINWSNLNYDPIWFFKGEMQNLLFPKHTCCTLHGGIGRGELQKVGVKLDRSKHWAGQWMACARSKQTTVNAGPTWASQSFWSRSAGLAPRRCWSSRWCWRALLQPADWWSSKWRLLSGCSMVLAFSI